MERMTFNVEELAKQLGVSKPTAYDLCKQEGFPAITVGKRIIIPVAAFEEWLMNSAGRKTSINSGR